MSCSSASSRRRSIASSASRASALALALALLLAGCATGPPLSAPRGPVPDLRGAWRGTWGGALLLLRVLEQDGAYVAGGVTVGPWPLTGDRLPGLTGVITYSVDGRPISANVQGRFGDWEGHLTLVLDLLNQHVDQIVLTRVAADRLAGNGASVVAWGPQGPVELLRAP
jgi:hypothetical protein